MNKKITLKIVFVIVTLFSFNLFGCSNDEKKQNEIKTSNTEEKIKKDNIIYLEEASEIILNKFKKIFSDRNFINPNIQIVPVFTEKFLVYDGKLVFLVNYKGEILIEKTMDNDISDIVPLKDGTYFITTYQTQSYNNGIQKKDCSFIYKVDEKFNILWEKSYLEQPFVSKLFSTQKGDLIIPFYGASKTRLIKLKSDGNLSWECVIDGSFHKKGIVLSDNSLVLSGYTYDNNAFTDNSLIIKISETGKTLWRNSFFSIIEESQRKQYQSKFIDIDTTSTGEIICLNRLFKMSSLQIIKIDKSNGNFNPGPIYNDADPMYKGLKIIPPSIFHSNDGGVFFYGEFYDRYDYPKPVIIKFDSNLKFAWCLNPLFNSIENSGFIQKIIGDGINYTIIGSIKEKICLFNINESGEYTEK